MSSIYTLYGSYASYYTAKVRSYLRKKGIPFVERLPSDPVFRSEVRPVSGTHRIPQLRTPEGLVVQDSIAIVDFLEVRFQALPALPGTPKQGVFVRLMELLASEGLVTLAWKHRWLFDENQPFITLDFGRSFRPQGSDAELLKYGQLITDRMISYGLPESTADVRAELEAQYLALLRLFEAHLEQYPYFLGGQPTQADYSIMGAMHAHLGRDPAGLRFMQDHAPRTFRWVENMLLPEVQAPEFFDVEIALLENDALPETAIKILEFLALNFAEPFVLGAQAFEAAIQAEGLSEGSAISPDEDQPLLQAVHIEDRGQDVVHRISVYAEWVSQRSRIFFQRLNEQEQASVLGALSCDTLARLLSEPVTHSLERVDQRFVIGRGLS
jgi:glutathione S-transferase